MKKLITLFSLLTISCVFYYSGAYAQSLATPCSAPIPGVAPPPHMVTGTTQSVAVKNAMTATPGNNYKTFTQPYKTKSAEAIKANAAYAQHPEANLLFPGTPCENCYELIDKRTEISKTFVKEGTSGNDGGKDIIVQTSTMSMHYHDAAGNWRTIKTNLVPDAANKGVYAATEQPAPVVINTAAVNKFSSIGKAGELIQFNRNLELIYAAPDGSKVSLGVANWTDYTAGDKGVYVKNAWPGIDIELRVFRGAIKTNFLINHAMPAYAAGTLLVRDHMQLDKGLSLIPTEAKNHTTEPLEIRTTSGEVKYVVSGATVYESANVKSTIQPIEYYLGDNNVLDIALPGNYLNKPASAYPVIIDPLVTLNTSIPVAGSSYNATWAAGAGCLYTNPANTPVNCTVTDIQFTFEYTATVSMLYGAFSFYKGTCRSPGTAAGGLSWSCNTTATGTCGATGGTTYSIFANMSSCLPAPSCASIPLNIQMYFYQNWNTTAACASTYVYGSQPLVMIVIGHTVEITGAGVTATPATICAGSSSTLAVTGVYGVPPYTWTWTPSGSGTPLVVTPTVTTTYSVTATDACGITAVAGKVVTVTPIDPITGPTAVCTGNTITLNDATAGGTWSSVSTGVATVVAGTGVVTGVSAGTSVIKYTIPGGCVVSYTVTVTPLPAAIGGPTSACTGSTITLTNGAAGGTWSSSNTAVATINPTTGVLSGVTAGTTTVTYTFGGSCFVIANITVNQLDPITGITTVCAGGTTNLSNINAGGTWASGTVAIATVGSGDGIVHAISPGVTVITYTLPTGCYATTPVTVNLLDPITGITTICEGSTTTLNDAAPGGAWSSSNNTVATIDPLTGDVAGIKGGTTTITYLIPLGCSSTTVVTVNPLPVISNATPVGPTTCLGADGSITLDGLTNGTSYSVDYTFNGTPAPTVTITAGPGPLVFISGLSAGTYTNIFVTDGVTGCVSNIVGPVTLNDPAPPPAPEISSNAPICIGQTLLLTATDAADDGTYSWSGPNGFTSIEQNPSIPNTVTATSGPYTVTYTINNCPSSTTSIITIYPPLTLTNVTASQSIYYGSSIQLNANGAVYYMWLPNDGSIDDPNINNPKATPLDSTVYMVIGTNLAGCKDTATVTVTINNNITEIVPSAFTPNGDGLNDVYRVGNMRNQKLVEFNIYNRWGQQVYHNAYDAKKGWDGTFNGVPQDAGVYNYSITVTTAEGVTKHYTGDVMLIR